MFQLYQIHLTHSRSGRLVCREAEEKLKKNKRKHMNSTPLDSEAMLQGLRGLGGMRKPDWDV